MHKKPDNVLEKGPEMEQVRAKYDNAYDELQSIRQKAALRELAESAKVEPAQLGVHINVQQSADSNDYMINRPINNKERKKHFQSLNQKFGTQKALSDVNSFSKDRHVKK